MKEQRLVTEEEYRKMVRPLAGFLFIEKDMLSEQTSGGIFIPTSSRDQQVKMSMTGVVVSKSTVAPTEAEWHYDLWQTITTGSRIGFCGTTPILSPLPPFYRLENNENKNEFKFVMIHVADVLCIIND